MIWRTANFQLFCCEQNGVPGFLTLTHFHMKSHPLALPVFTVLESSWIMKHGPQICVRINWLEHQHCSLYHTLHTIRSYLHTLIHGWITIHKPWSKDFYSKSSCSYSADVNWGSTVSQLLHPLRAPVQRARTAWCLASKKGWLDPRCWIWSWEPKDCGDLRVKSWLLGASRVLIVGSEFGCYILRSVNGCWDLSNRIVYQGHRWRKTE